nr:DUF2798 domain-containing protein [uncultured Carboxylicivirga sp.]
MKMPINRKEQLVYTFLMVIFMVITMTLYNNFLNNGFSINSIKNSWLSFPFTFIVAFICEWFVVSRIGMSLLFKILKDNDSNMKKMLITPLIIVFGMATLMSLYGTILSVGFTNQIPIIWLRNFSINFIFAYPLQILIARPLITFVFRKVFPVGTIIAK